MADNKIALFAFQETNQTAQLVLERHYRLVQPQDLSNQELLEYQNRLD